MTVLCSCERFVLRYIYTCMKTEIKYDDCSIRVYIVFNFYFINIMLKIMLAYLVVP